MEKAQGRGNTQRKQFNFLLQTQLQLIALAGDVGA